ncbi:hypothetical protein ABT124_36930 [Streptomyces sp. NPDC001982]|uniref:hypothetical protein n=1 Tax=unclassified Streptomyces TaxID=2593676 RepID=UPI0033331C78
MGLPGPWAHGVPSRGAAGDRTSTWPHVVVVALTAHEVRRPGKIVLSRLPSSSRSTAAGFHGTLPTPPAATFAARITPPAPRIGLQPEHLVQATT